MAEKTVKTKAGTFKMIDNEGSGWMIEGDWNNWKRYIRKKEYRRAKAHQVNYNEKADALIRGSSMEEANSIGGMMQEEIKAEQSKNARKKGVQKLVGQTKQFLSQHGGKVMMVAGTVATVIPYVGWIAGPAVVALGKKLDEKQTAAWMAKVAQSREKDLLELKDQFEGGQIDATQYKTKAQGVILDEMQNIKAKSEAEAIAQVAAERQQQSIAQKTKIQQAKPIDKKSRTAAIKRWEPEEKKEVMKSSTKVAIGAGVGVVVISGVLAAIALSRRGK